MIIIETCPKCGHDLHDEMICTNPPIPRKVCYSCGWSWEGKQEEVVRVPFQYEFGKQINGAKENTITQEELHDIQKRFEEFVRINWATHGDMHQINDDNTLGNQIGTCDMLNGILNLNYKDTITKQFKQDACFSCPSNPKNGGDGICFCTLGQLNVAY